MAVKVQLLIFWVYMPCNTAALTGVLEEPTASIFCLEDQYVNTYSFLLHYSKV